MKIILLILPIFLLATTGCSLSGVSPKTQTPITTPIEANSSTSVSTTPKVSCDKEENCCIKDEDCKYIWFTGGCNTPEYIAKIQKEAAAAGIRNGEASPRDNVTCTCENTKCITHN